MDLIDFFNQHHKVAIAFSGGIDSAYLLYTAKAYGAKVEAYYVKSAFQPDFEWQDAVRFADSIQVKLNVICLDVLSDEEIRKNTKDRCYYCKKRIFSAITKKALQDGYDVLCDGTNASDDAGDRPGMKALSELHILSPLRKCGLVKSEIRRLSREAGISLWNKPAYACLATRIQTGEPITVGKLEKTELAENYLHALGFSDFRVRMSGDVARIQLRAEDFDKIVEQRENILQKLKQHYSAVTLDMEVRG